MGVTCMGSTHWRTQLLMRKYVSVCSWLGGGECLTAQLAAHGSQLTRLFGLAFLLALPGTAFASDSGESVESRAPRVLLETQLGDIVIELADKKAPVTVNNFLRYVDAGMFTGGSFYRAVTVENDNGSPVIEVIQGGHNEAMGSFPAIDHESTDKTGLRHLNGTISMARGAVGTALGAFFICIGDQPGLDYGGQRNADRQGFAAFGRVVSGMDVVREIHASEVTTHGDDAYVRGQMLDEPVIIDSAQRLRSIKSQTP